MKHKFIILLLMFIVLSIISCEESSGEEGADSVNTQLSSKKDSKMEILEKLTLNLPEEIQETILADTDDFLNQIATVLTSPEELFLLADKQHSLGADYKPDDIVMLTDYPDLVISRDDRSLRKILIPDLLSMVEDARKEGLTLLISSAYRSYEYQDRLFKWNVEQNGLETAERESARAGTSQHQLGTAIDFGSITDDYAFTPPGRWLTNNAWKYGFSLSYPEGYENITGYRHEVWHYRYISPEAAKLQKDYFNDIQYYLLAFLNEHKEELKSLL